MSGCSWGCRLSSVEHKFGDVTAAADHRANLLVDVDHAVDDVAVTALECFLNGFLQFLLVAHAPTGEPVGFRQLDEIRRTVKRCGFVVLVIKTI